MFRRQRNKKMNVSKSFVEEAKEDGCNSVENERCMLLGDSRIGTYNLVFKYMKLYRIINLLWLFKNYKNSHSSKQASEVIVSMVERITS